MRVIYTSKGMSKKFGVHVIYRKIRYSITETFSLQTSVGSKWGWHYNSGCWIGVWP